MLTSRCFALLFKLITRSWFLHVKSISCMTVTPSHQQLRRLRFCGTCWNAFLRGFSYWVNLTDAQTSWYVMIWPHFPSNTLRPRQNGRHFTDDIFKRIFYNENIWIPIKISLKFVPKVSINNIPALVQIMAWRRSGDKPLSEPMMVNLTTHICVTRPHWVKQPVGAQYKGPMMQSSRFLSY